jgi:hypothetical protein
MAQHTFNFNGPVGAVLSGTQATATINQSWSQQSVTDAIATLKQVRDVVQQLDDVEDSVRDELLANVDSATLELHAKKPSAVRIAALLGGVGTAVQTVAAVQPAWEVAKLALRALGVPI